MEDESNEMLGQQYDNVITQDKEDPDYYGNIDEDYLKKRIEDLTRPMLVCGPPAFNEAMEKALKNIGVKEALIDLGS